MKLFIRNCSFQSAQVYNWVGRGWWLVVVVVVLAEGGGGEGEGEGGRA